MTVSPWRRAGGFLIGGHRGASANHPENTLAALAGAFAVGADFVETDLRLTRDGVPIAAHDSDFGRLAGNASPVAELDLAEAQRLMPGLMTIAEAITAAGDGGVLLDTKITDAADVDHAAGVLAPLLARGTVAFGARTLAAATTIRAVLPDCPVLGLFSDYGDYGALADLGGQWARLWQPDASAAAIAALHHLGLKVLIMAGEPTPDGVGWIQLHALDRLIADGADGVMLNDPAFAVARRAATAVTA